MNYNKLAISVIVLLYNAEATIEKCVHSLFNQTMSDKLEYIFVDDFSTDNGVGLLQQIIDTKYAHLADQIRIIRQPQNRGTGTARNTGLDQAQGEYIIYCDSDDYVALDIYEKLYSKALQSTTDIVFCDYAFIDDKKGIRVNVKGFIPPLSNTHAVKNALGGVLHNAMWNKLIRKSLFTNNHIRFPEGINMWEDVAVLIRLYHFARMSYLPEALYNYIYRPGSVTSQKSLKNFQDQIAVVQLIEAFYAQHNPEILKSPEFAKFKFRAKHILLGFKDKVQIKNWYNTYSDTNKLLITHKEPKHKKLVHLLNACYLFWVSNAVEKGIQAVKKIA
ncbi:MAG: glycosyltransferase family 2 protein [Chitinophagaceae bacterium]|nr:MAG: glycosyltransferase family 2 protein [Chitinophagaceae bacterium]